MSGQAIVQDLVQPFRIEGSEVRGRLVRLGPAVDEVLSRHAYPPAVAGLLGEALALAAALSAVLKYDGLFTFQAKGDGPVKMLVADVTTKGAVRGYAQFDPARLAAALEGLADATTMAEAVPRILGKGYLAFTVDQGAHTELYQGIVELTGNTLADCVHHYFTRSEQIETDIRVATGQSDGRWRAASLVAQRMPDAAREGTAFREGEEEWRRVRALLQTCSREELLDFSIDPGALLFRLFHEDGVRVYRPSPLQFGCRCSHERAVRVLRSIPKDQLGEFKVDGQVTMTCEFCGTSYAFDDAALGRLGEG
ncbi:MAG: Hsp33 family molecular chaperone HslO [Alphaproteobacteria bacterium]